MPSIRVDFYLLADRVSSARWLLACRLLEKAYLRGHHIFVYCNNREETEYLDELLWTFKDNSFIPHNIQGEGPEPPPAVQLGFQQEPRSFNDILLNLSQNVPTFYPRFNRIIEIVENNENAKHQSRNHFREYREKQCQLFTHNIA